MRRGCGAAPGLVAEEERVVDKGECEGEFLLEFPRQGIAVSLTCIEAEAILRALRGVASGPERRESGRAATEYSQTILRGEEVQCGEVQYIQIGAGPQPGMVILRLRARGLSVDLDRDDATAVATLLKMGVEQLKQQAVTLESQTQARSENV